MPVVWEGGCLMEISPLTVWSQLEELSARYPRLAVSDAIALVLMAASEGERVLAIVSRPVERDPSRCKRGHLKAGHNLRLERNSQGWKMRRCVTCERIARRRRRGQDGEGVPVPRVFDSHFLRSLLAHSGDECAWPECSRARFAHGSYETWNLCAAHLPRLQGFFRRQRAAYRDMSRKLGLEA
jgi:hypothetical protein